MAEILLQTHAPLAGNSAHDRPPKQIMDRFITRLNDVIAKEKQAKASKQDSLENEEKNTATNKPETKERPLVLRFLSHTRAWTEGVSLGSKQFVSRMASLFYSNEELRDRKFRRGNSSDNEEICCFSPPLLVAARPHAPRTKDQGLRTDFQ
jgi:hypothetical protein